MRKSNKDFKLIKKVSLLRNRQYSKILSKRKKYVLPEATQKQLNKIVIETKNKLLNEKIRDTPQATKFMEGTLVVFVGASGSEKSSAAEVLANELNLDLYRIDLSSVVNKYIGETEKNIRKIFDAAEISGVILMFDEADALFGKRTETKDSHDSSHEKDAKYTILERLEKFNGVTILMVNNKENIDDSFVRHIRYILEFPKPEQNQRELVWAKIFKKKKNNER